MLPSLHTELVAPTEPRAPRKEAPGNDFAPSLDKAQRAEARREAKAPRAPKEAQKGDEYGAGVPNPQATETRQRDPGARAPDAGHKKTELASAQAATPRQGQAQRSPGSQVQVVEPRDGAHLQLSGDGLPLMEGRARDGAHLALRFDQASVRAVPEASAEAPAAQTAWRLWADRIQAAPTRAPTSEAQAVDPAPDVQPQPEAPIEATPAEEASEAALEVGDLDVGTGNLGGGGSGGLGEGRSGDGEGFRAGSGQRFEIPAQAADVLKDPSGASAGVRTRTGEVAQAVREIARARVHTQGSKSGTAQVELSIDGERVVVKVRLNAGRVDVEVRGLEAGELVRLRQQLGPELERQALQLGHVRDEEALSGDAQGQGSRRRGSEADEEADQGSVFDVAALLEDADPDRGQSVQSAV